MMLRRKRNMILDLVTALAVVVLGCIALSQIANVPGVCG